jgi:endonuclease G
MPFRVHLQNADLLTLTQAAIDGDLFEIDRSLRLQGIERGFVLALKNAASPLDQFQLDLDAANRVERLADGQVPMVLLLDNSASQLALRRREQAKVFEKYANLIGNQTQGVAGLPETSRLPEVVSLEAIIGQDDMVDLAFLQGGVSVGQSVARILVPRFENGEQIFTAAGAPWTMNGTAWIIAPGLAITNHHVINARGGGEPAAGTADFVLQGQRALFEFDFNSADAIKATAKAARVEFASSELDYAILRMEETFRRPALILMPRRVEVHATTYMPVNIIQHPHGKLKRVAIRNNLVTGADDQIIRYFTDTDFGSSGSPVCDDRWQVVALHRGAKLVEGVRFQGKQTAYVNFGSQIQAVLRDLQQRQPALFTEIGHSQTG